MGSEGDGRSGGGADAAPRIWRNPFLLTIARGAGPFPLSRHTFGRNHPRPKRAGAAPRYARLANRRIFSWLFSYENTLRWKRPLKKAKKVIAFLTPICKGYWWPTMATEVTNIGIQVYGVTATCAEWGMEQLVRDTRMPTLLREATNGHSSRV